MMRKMTIAIIGIAIMTGMASAAVLNPVSASQNTSGAPGVTDADNLIDPSRYVGTKIWQPVWAECWYSSATATDEEWVYIDLGDVYDITEIRIWNFGDVFDPDVTGRGAKNISVHVAGPGAVLPTPNTTVTTTDISDSLPNAFLDASWTSIYDSNIDGDLPQGQDSTTTTAGVLVDAQLVIPTVSSVRYVAIDVDSKYTGDPYTTNEVALSYVMVIGGVSKAHTPDPYSGETEIALDKVLSWVAPDAYTPTGYTVFLDPNETLVSAGDISVDVTATDDDGDATNEQFVPPADLQSYTTYYWRVDSTDPNDGTPFVNEGDVWSFQTDLVVPGTLITPTAAVATTELAGLARYAVDCINGDGLTGFAHNNADTDMWMASGIYGETWGNPPVDDYDPNIVFDLGAFFDVTSIREWGYNAPSIPGFGPDEVDVYTSADGVLWTSAGTENFALAPGTNGYIGTVHPVSYSSVRYIKFDIMTSHDGAIFGPTEVGDNGGADGRSLVGLSEIRFYGTLLSPLLQSDPTPLTVTAGDEATFSVSADLAVSYQWYKDGSPLSNGGDISGADSNSLSIANVDVTDEAFYHCDISGDQSVESASAQLMTERLVGHWKLDGDLTDSVAATVAGAPTYDGVFLPDSNSVYVTGVDGVAGNALSFGSDPNNIVSLAGTEAFYSFYTRGYTASFWAKPPADALAVAFFNKFDGTGFSHYRAGLGSVAYIDGVAITGALTADEWNFFVLTYDADSGARILYHNGTPQVFDTIGLPASGNSTAAATIGGPSVGVMDDIKFYSKALSWEEIAQEYLDTVGGDPICITPPALDIAPVGALDCKVDLLDFAELAKAWLEDGNLYAP